MFKREYYICFIDQCLDKLIRNLAEYWYMELEWQVNGYKHFGIADNLENAINKFYQSEYNHGILIDTRNDLEGNSTSNFVKFSFEANKYFNDTEPWSFKNKQPERMKTILNTIVLQIRNISILLNPIIPLSTKKVLDTINISDKDILISNINNRDNLNNEKKLKSLDILFKKIENDN